MVGGAARSVRPGRKRARVAAALVALGALLQGCVGVAVRIPVDEDLDVRVVSAELRALAATSPAPDATPRRRRLLESVRVEESGARTAYTYTQWPSFCMPVMVVTGPAWPGCLRTDTYIVEAGELVSARRRRYPAYGLVCTPVAFLTSGLRTWPCEWRWGEGW